ncbi:hypothetical protein C5167_006570 [Papaver somniferum]|uniref:Uncharacterized protein n=1 Tax=Papaver somniferum TaxID=3469 RepID=A0A4Y7JHJ6_PAPSO|nr:hypothetical protein C5167_006570 [Papaver somniferum]
MTVLYVSKRGCSVNITLCGDKSINELSRHIHHLGIEQPPVVDVLTGLC